MEDKFLFFTEDVEYYKERFNKVICLPIEKFSIYVNVTHNSIVYFDTEATDLDAYKAKMLLTSMKIDDTVIIIDNLTIGYDYYKYIISRFNELGVEFVGHNIKYDCKVLKTNYNVMPKKVFDTMIAEQRIFQGYGFSANNLTGIRFRLASNDENEDCLLKRYLGTVPSDIDKSERNTFAGINWQDYKFSESQILYSGNDVKYLDIIRNKQMANINKYNYHRLLFDIEFPLVIALAQCELNGLNVDIPKMKELFDNNEKKLFEISCKLDEEFRKVRDRKRGDVSYIKNGRYDRKRVFSKMYQGNLYSEDEDLDLIDKKGTPFINWESTQQIQLIFGYLGKELPTNDGNYEIPTVHNGKVREKNYFKTGKNELQQMMIEKDVGNIKHLIELLIEYREYSMLVKTFGEKWLIKSLNPITHKIHTIYRQCGAVNGRFQSGGGKNEPDKINSQNIPAREDYRSCFIARPGYSLTTCDLSGAEVTIMADKAADYELYKIAVINDDAHSPIAQYAWRQIYLYRAGREIGLWDNWYTFKKNKNKKNYINLLLLSKNPIVIENMNLHKTLIVSKEENKRYRKIGKTLTFGSVYGCKAKKAAKTLNVNYDEGFIYINSVKEFLPKTFNSVEYIVEIALKTGKLVINERTNSTIWFPDVIYYLKKGYDIDDNTKYNVDGQARNIPISGTQADMIKEAIVEIDKIIKKNRLDCYLLLQVHDELLYEQPLCMDGQSDEFKANPIYVEHEGKNYTFPDLIQHIMASTANKYLNYFRMQCSKEVGNCWKK